jgi:hypothetical protein
VAGEAAGLAARIARAHRRLGGSMQHCSINGSTKNQLPIVARLFLRPDDLFQIGHTRETDRQRFRGEGIELFDADDLGVLVPSRVARLDQIIGDLARCKARDASHPCPAPIGSERIRMKWLLTHEILRLADRQLVAQQRLGRHDDQRLAERACIWRRSAWK